MRLLAFLRSRRLAVWLLVAITVYSFLATWLNPQGVPGAATDQDASGLLGALKLDRPFLAPVFLAAVALITLSTAACAWERTRSAIRVLRPQPIGDQAERNLLRAPQLTLLPAEAMDRTMAIDAAEQAMRGLRLRTVRTGDTVAARGSALGPLGSALFHWALVGLFAFAGIGQLTRYEGYVNLVPGGSVQDTPSAYELELLAGPWVRDAYTGLTLTTVEVNTNLVVDGQEQGGAVLVALSDATGEIKRQWVYPNSPLKYGSLIMHRSEVPPVLIGRVEAEAPEDAGGVTLYYDMETRAPRGFTVPSVLTAEPIEVSIEPLGNQRLSVTVSSAGETSSQTIGVGDRVELPDGRAFVVDELTYAAQLHVVNDWSVPWIYAMFVLGTIGVSMAVFLPVRSAWVVVAENNEAGARIELRVGYTPRRNDPAFPRALREALARASNADAVHEGEVVE